MSTKCKTWIFYHLYRDKYDVLKGDNASSAFATKYEYRALRDVDFCENAETPGYTWDESKKDWIKKQAI